MTAPTFSTLGALIGLVLAIILIVKKVHPAYSLIFGALIGGLIGGGGLADTVKAMVTGAQSMMSPVLRIMTSGILAGALIKTGSAETIADTIVKKLGQKRAIAAIAIATMIICAVGVFIDIAVITVAPIAIAIAKKANLSKAGILLAMIGGGKAGNIISPNANTIAAAKGFGLNLSQVMIADFIPAVVALFVTVLVASLIKHKGDPVVASDLEDDATPDVAEDELPSLGASLVTPIVAIVLLLINPIGQICHVEWMSKINLDATYVLPIAAIIGALAMHKAKNLEEYAKTGMIKMTPVVMILIGAGAIGATITESSLPQLLINAIKVSHISGVFLAPLSGILMASAAASTSTGVILATGSFSKAILGFGVNPLAAAAMVHTGAIVCDQLPQGNYFHVTANAMHMDIKQRSQGILYEAICGGSACLTATVLYGFLHLI